MSPISLNERRNNAALRRDPLDKSAGFHQLLNENAEANAGLEGPSSSSRSTRPQE